MTNHDQELQDLAQRRANTLALVNDVDKQIKIISTMTPKLKNNPNPTAVTAMLAALKEIMDTWEVTDEAFKMVWNLYQKDGDLKESSADLLDIGNFNLEGHVKQGRGHCHKIWELYLSDLRPWFQTALSVEDQNTMENTFSFLGNMDMDAFMYMEYFAGETEKTANQVLDLVMSNRPDEARQIAGGLLQTIRPMRTNINRSLVGLEHLQAEFSSIATAAPPPVPASAPSFWNNQLAKEFHTYFVAVYNYQEAEIMLKFELDKRLDVLVAPGGFNAVAFDLIDIAEQEGWIIELVQAAHQGIPSDPQLADFAQRIDNLSS